MSEPVRKQRRRLGLPRIKFIFGAGEVLPGRWYFGVLGFYDRTEAQRQQGIAVSVRGLLWWSAGLLVAAYIAAASALYFLWNRSPYSLLTYSDALFYPVRRAVILDKKGQAFIAQGLDLWRAQKYHEAATLLRLGLERHPRDIRGRTTLAQYYLLLNRRTVALTTLTAGLTDEYPGRAYLQTLFEIAEQGEDYEQIAALCVRYRAAVAAGGEVRDQRWLQSRQFSALLAAGRAAEALQLAEADAAWSDLAGEQRVLALLALKRADDAVRVLEDWRNRPKADVRLVTRLQVRALREAGRHDEMDRAIAALRQLDPAQSAPVVYGVVQRSMAGRKEAARAALEEYLFRFGKSTADLQLVAEPLAEVDDLPLVERCAAAAAERGYPAHPYQVLLVQLLVQRGDWTGALQLLSKITVATSPGRNGQALRLWHEWMRRLAEAGQSPADPAQAALLEFLRQRPWPMKIFRKTIEALSLGGRWETARDITGIARVAFPASKWLQSQQETIAKTLKEREPAVPALASPNPAAEARRWTEPAFTARLAELLAAAQWEDSDELIRSVREAQPPPAWFARRDDVIRLAQVRIAHGRGSVTEMTAAARVYLNGDAIRLNALLDLAREYYRADDKSSALLLAKEVLRKSPDFPPAKRQLGEWEPKPVRK